MVVKTGVVKNKKDVDSKKLSNIKKDVLNNEVSKKQVSENNFLKAHFFYVQ